MELIGLSGGIGSGKSTVSDFLRELGARVVDADEGARAVVLPGTPGFEAVVAHQLADDGPVLLLDETLIVLLARAPAREGNLLAPAVAEQLRVDELAAVVGGQR